MRTIRQQCSTIPGRRDVLLGLIAAALARPAWAVSPIDYDSPAFLDKFRKTFDPLIGVVPKAPLQAMAINSVSIRVSDLRRSIEFYRKNFGLRVHARQGPAVACMGIGHGPHFLKLVRMDTPERIYQPCLTVKDFDAERVKKILERLRIPDVQLKYRGPEMGGGGPGAPKGTPEIFFRDLDGLQFQIQGETYSGGAGLNGDVVSPEPVTDDMLDVPVRASTINHVTMHHVDVIGASLFVQKIFSMPILTYQDKAINPVFGVGADLVPALGSAPLRGNDTKAMISHFCFGVKFFDPNTFKDKMMDAGFGPAAAGPPRPLTVSAPPTPSGEKGPDGKPIVQSGFVYDPDGTMVQVSHVKFCAGFGPLGAVCEGRKI